MPRQFTNLGDRLVFANGIVTLTGAAVLLIVLFKGNTHALVPLFAVGAFLAFTLSQAGMVVHWLRQRERGWQLKAFINGLGALVTFTSLIVIGYSKFAQGAWISIALIPLIVAVFFSIRKHYRSIARQLSLRGLPPSLKPFPPPRVVIPVSGVHRGMIDAVNFASSMTSDVTAVYIEMEPEATPHVLHEWREWFPDIPIEVVPSPYRSMVGPLLDYSGQNRSEA